MKLRTGTLVPGSETPVGDGISDPMRGAVIVEQEQYGAIIKRISPAGVLAECFCGLLLRAWNIPVPEPVLVVEEDTLIFASLDTSYPSLKKHIGWHRDLPDTQKKVVESIGAAIACALPDAPLVLAADEAIANNDRNLGNILWDGTDHAYVDHERTLEIVPHLQNLMATFSYISNTMTEIEKSAVAAALTLSAEPLQAIEVPNGIDVMPLVEYVEKRIPTLAMRVLDRFPKPKDLLEFPPP